MKLPLPFSKEFLSIFLASSSPSCPVNYRTNCQENLLTFDFAWRSFLAEESGIVQCPEGNFSQNLSLAQWLKLKHNSANIVMTVMVYAQALLGTIEMVSRVADGVCSSTIRHHRNSFYGAQWYLNKHYRHHWAL